MDDSILSYRLILTQVLLMLGTLLLFFMWIFVAVLNPAQEDEFYTNLDLSPVELRMLSAARVNTNLPQFQQNLVDLPWIKQAELHRKVLDGKEVLQINLVKKLPLAKLPDGSYLFADGEVLKGIWLENSDKLPPIEFAKRELDPETVRFMENTAKLAAKHGINVKEYKLAANGNLDIFWNLGSDNLQLRAGHAELSQRFARLEKFIGLRGASALASIRRIDLRHQKALAVLWAG